MTAVRFCMKYKKNIYEHDYLITLQLQKDYLVDGNSAMILSYLKKLVMNFWAVIGVFNFSSKCRLVT